MRISYVLVRIMSQSLEDDKLDTSGYIAPEVCIAYVWHVPLGGATRCVISTQQPETVDESIQHDAKDTYGTAVQNNYIRNRNAGLGWISFLRMGALYTNFSITTDFFVSCKSQPAFLIARFLTQFVGVHRYCCNT